MSKASSAAYRKAHLEEVREKDRIRGRARYLANPGAMKALAGERREE